MSTMTWILILAVVAIAELGVIIWFAVALERDQERTAELMEQGEKDFVFYTTLNTQLAEQCMIYRTNAKAYRLQTDENEQEINRLRQELKSATLCPRNDHVWKDGRCVKCGRVKDAAD